MSSTKVVEQPCWALACRVLLQVGLLRGGLRQLGLVWEGLLHVGLVQEGHRACGTCGSGMFSSRKAILTYVWS